MKEGIKDYSQGFDLSSTFTEMGKTHGYNSPCDLTSC